MRSSLHWSIHESSHARVPFAFDDCVVVKPDKPNNKSYAA